MADKGKEVIKNADMPEDLQTEVIELTYQALERFTVEKDMCAHIKKELDKKHNSPWHVCIGKNFGTYVTHETKKFIYFNIGELAFLIYKSG
ncbi:Dynein light chain [Spironucleus salmonicida]|uniref:Dynein light chain n=1 Tax=Spironucleus salmonicida TaxID=348837 RepID=V6LLZ2_9EUKA|nr:Dynein light chain [Spironucleus salmonicida]|eukprot:EST45707.1 Dynein light chain [Spironucleus salmonicida]